MAVSILQERQTSNGSGGASSIALAFSSSVTSGSSIHTMCGSDDTAAASFTCSDSVNGSHGTAIDSFDDSGNAYRVSQFNFDNTASGTPTVTITPNVSAGLLAIWFREVGNTSGKDGAQHVINRQISPGTSTDGTTSGSLTPSVQPGLTSGLCLNTANFSLVSAGTGFTNGLTGWQVGTGSDLARSESLRYTTTTSKSATFTATDGAATYCTFAVLYKETSGADTLMPQVCL